MPTPGRKARAPAPAKPDVTNHEAVRTALVAVDDNALRMETLREVLGDLVDLTTDRLWGEVEFLISRTADDMLQLGLRLLTLKEKLPYGEFGAEVQRRGLSPQAASRFMRAALKFAGTAKVKSLGRTKLLELTVLDEGDIAELDAGGTVLGLTLDSIDCMGTLELRNALRESLQEKAANEQIIADKDKKLNEQDRKRRNLPETQEWPKECAALLDEIRDATKKALPFLSQLNQRVAQLDELMGERQPDAEQAKVTAIEAINMIHLLVNMLAPTQAFAYGAFRNYIPSEYTSLLTPKGEAEGE